MSNTRTCNRHQIHRRYLSRALFVARRHHAKITRRELGKLLGLSTKEIMRIEDANRIMSPEILTKILAAGIRELNKELLE